MPQTFIRALGEDHGLNKLSEEDVHEIRSLIAAGLSNNEIGRMFHVSGTNIWSIRNKKSWAWLT